MNTYSVDIQSRISARAIIAGVVTTFAALILSMTLSAGLCNCGNCEFFIAKSTELQGTRRKFNFKKALEDKGQRQ